MRIYTKDDGVLQINPSFNRDLEFEVSFSCRMSLTPGRNGGQVTITNLSERDMNSIAGVTSRLVDYTNVSLGPGTDGFIPLPGGKILTGADVVPGGIAREETINNGSGYVEVDAGDLGDVGRVFEGSCQDANHEHEGTHWFTQLNVNDGLSTMIGGHVNDRFPAGSSFYSVVRHLVKSMGLDTGNLTEAQLQASFDTNSPSNFPNGFITIGNPQLILRKILTSSGAEWFVDRGTFYIVRKGEALPGRSAEVDIQTGLSSRPKPLPDGGVGITTRFRKDIRVGRKVALESTQLSGDYRCEVVTHNINNYLGEWTTSAILRRGTAISGLGI